MLSKREYAFWICAFYITSFAFLIYGTFNDLAVDDALYNPSQLFSRFMEDYGEFPRWATWGPLSAVLFSTRDWESKTTVNVLSLIFKKMKATTKEKLLKIGNLGYGIGYLVLGYFGWQKLIKNVVKHWFSDDTKETAAYKAILITAILIVDFAVLILTDKFGNKQTLYKLKPLAFGGIVFGILYQYVITPIKIHMNRTRYYVLLEQGSTANFTRWYQPGCGGDSFPSGHTGSAAATFLSLTLCDKLKKFENRERLFFIVSWAYTYLMAYSRMVMGRHYLTDVAMGAILSFTFVLIVRELFVKRFCKKIGL